MKRLFNVLLVGIASIIGVLSVSAASGTITINKGIVGEKYTIYRILDLETYDTSTNSYIYRANSNWKNFVNDASLGGMYLDAKNENGATYYVWKTNADVKAFADLAMKYADDNNISSVASKTATSTTISFTGLDLGYYLVKSSVGILVHLTTTDPNGVVYEKNTIVPDVDKLVKEDSLGTYGKKNDAQIGDVVEYKTTITVGAGYQSYKLYDIMDNGLTFDASSLKVIYNNSEVEDDYYTLSTSEVGYTFTVTFSDEYIAGLPKGAVLTVEYNAVLNEDAVIESTGNDNKTYLEYGNKVKTDEKKTTTYTYAFNLVKTNSSKEKLNGAEFKLYDKNDVEVLVVLKDAESNTYRVAVLGEDGVTIKAGSAIIEGLDADSYKLEEVVAPTGYNKLTSKVDFTTTSISSDNTIERVTVSVVNYTGNELPETGSVGTMMFITIGSILVVGFGLLLVTKIRLSKEEI